MSALSAFILLAAMSHASTADLVTPMASPVTKPALVEVPKGPNSLTLYNAKGEVVARCEKVDDGFGKCKMEPGVTLDDVMNAWVHAYQDLEK